MSLKLNLKGWHKVGSDKTHTTMRDPKGHEMRVCHKALSREHRAALDKLPIQMAEGGVVSGGHEQSGMEAIKKERYRSMAKGGLVEHHFDGGVTGEEEQLAPLLSQTPQMSQMPQMPSPEQQVDMIRQEAEAHPFSPEQLQLQTAYNQDITAKHMGEPDSNELLIGGWNEPKHLDPVSLEKAKLNVEAGKLAQAEKAQKGVQDVTEQNALRAQVGLPPLPTPPMLSPAALTPAVSPVSARIAVDAAPGNGAELVPQTGSNAPQMGTPEPGLPSLKAGMTAQADAMAQQAQRDQLILKKQEADMARAESEFNRRYEDLDAQRLAISRDLESSRIKPNQLMDNMNFGQRLATAIGMIVGGAGAGLLHQENPVMSMLNKQITADIEAQKANLGKKENLLAMNLKQYGNLKDAEQATRLMANDMVLNKLKQSLAQAQGPLAKAQLQQEIAKLDMQQKGAMQKLSLEGSIRDTVAKDPSSFDTLIQQMRVFDPKRAVELEQQFVPGMGIARTIKDADTLKEGSVAATKVRQSVSRLLAISAVPGAAFNPKLRAEANVLTSMLVGNLNRAVTGGGPMSTQEQEIIRAMVADPTVVMSLNATTKAALNTLVGRVNAGMAAEAKSRGIDNYDPVNSLPPQEKALAMWARQTPGDPRAPLVLQKLGLSQL